MVMLLLIRDESSGIIWYSWVLLTVCVFYLCIQNIFALQTVKTVTNTTYSEWNGRKTSLVIGQNYGIINSGSYYCI